MTEPKKRAPTFEDRAHGLTAKPAQTTLTVVSSATLMFFAAERGHNPKVRTIWDALVYVTTCLSVGYGDIFAVTPVGKIVGSYLMTIGPALSGATLDGARAAEASTDAP